MDAIPLTQFDGYLKQVSISEHDQESILLFNFLFPAFADERTVLLTDRQKLLESAFSPFVEAAVDRRQPRRFAGPYLPRGRYFSLCIDSHGNDGGTLTHELRAYRDPARSGMVEVVDLGIGNLTLAVGTKTYKFDRQPAMGVLAHHPDRIPQEFASQIAHRLDDGAGRLIWMFKFPYSVQETVIENVVDLRLPATQAWFHEHFSAPQPGQAIMWPEQLDAGPGSRWGWGAVSPTIAVSRFRQYEGRAPVPKDFYHMLPTLMNPHVGGGLASSTGSTVQSIGAWMRHNSVSAFAYPSSRADAFVQVEDGQLRSFGGWNLVDYRAIELDTQIEMSYFDHSPWCWVTFPRGVSVAVAYPNSDTAGSFRIRGMVNYWAEDYLELVKSLDVMAAELAIPATKSDIGTESTTRYEAWKVGIHTVRWLRVAFSGGSEEDIRVAIRVLRGLAARCGLLDILGEIDEIADDLGEDGDLNKALRACVSLNTRAADRFMSRSMTEREQLTTVASNLELFMLYLSIRVRDQIVPESGTDLTRYRRLPLPDVLRSRLAAYLNEAAAEISGAGGSEQAILRKGSDLEASIAGHLRSSNVNEPAHSTGEKFSNRPDEPFIFECASMTEAGEFLARLTCPPCGSPVDSTHKESREDPSRGHRMLDYFDATCNTCRFTWPLVVAIQY